MCGGGGWRAHPRECVQTKPTWVHSKTINNPALRTPRYQPPGLISQKIHFVKPSKNTKFDLVVRVSPSNRSRRIRSLEVKQLLVPVAAFGSGIIRAAHAKLETAAFDILHLAAPEVEVLEEGLSASECRVQVSNKRCIKYDGMMHGTSHGVSCGSNRAARRALHGDDGG